MLSIVMPILILHPVVERMTIESVDSIYKNTLGEWELILVVHGGPNFGFTFEYPRMKTIYRKRRMAISEAYNAGFKKSRGDILCCMHNDTVVPFGWNYLMDRVAKRGDIAFPMVDESRGFCELRGIKKTESWQTPSACFVFSRETWNQLGGYDEQFEEMHGEDIDLFRVHVE